MKLKNLRWWVITLIALATVINYIDRQSLSVLWPEIVKDLFPDESAFERKQIYANISIIFVFSYAFGQAIFGKIFDWIGTRLGFVLAIGVWSVATILHAFAHSILTFSLFRGLLGLEGSEHIHRICLHPTNPDVAYVAAMGTTWATAAAARIS